MDARELWDERQAIAIICYQWGDSGKGKIVDLLAEDADIIARGTGGANAGHTVVIGGKRYIFHLVPSGILYDREGKYNILGNGMVIDLERLVAEMKALDGAGVSFNHMLISEDANIVLPWHIQKDRGDVSQKVGGIGTTGRGIGPTYSDKHLRTGLLVRDLFKPETLDRKLRKLGSEYVGIEGMASVGEVRETLNILSKDIRPYVANTIGFIHNAMTSGKKILIEGAQGSLLSIEFGTKKFVTSSDCTVSGASSGIGIAANRVDLTLGIVKFPYMTRVGGGPFMSELGGEKSEQYCASEEESKLEEELKRNNIPYETREGIIRYDHDHPKIKSLMSSSDDMEKGIGLRLKGDEYGATTGRARRTGWTDLVSLKYAMNVNGSNRIFLTKADVASGLDTMSLVTNYVLNGVNVEFTTDSDVLRKVKTTKLTMPGYGSLDGIKEYKDLPANLKGAIGAMELYTSGRVMGLSTGCERDAYVMRQ